MKLGVQEAGVEFARHVFRKPLVLSSGRIDSLTEAVVSVSVRAGPREAVGRGSILLSDLWAWPDADLTHDEKDRRLRDFCSRIAAYPEDFCGSEPVHPLEIGLRLHDSACRSAAMPALASAMCASPFDAAIHDAAGRLAGCQAFDLYDGDDPVPTADPVFGGRSACAAVRAAVTGRRTVLEAWWIVCPGDCLDAEFAQAVRAHGFRRFKIKLSGTNSGADAARTAEVYRAGLAFGATSPRVSVDSNEGNSDCAQVLEYLERLERIDKAAYDALLYLEQPTARDMSKARVDWRPVSSRKPVFIDEGLTGLDVCPLLLEQRWSGLALKTCKGHSFALVAAAWALEHGMPVALQDLTNPGLSAIHAALFASRVPTINGVELNSPQFIPSANSPWLPRLSGLFEVKDGLHRAAGISSIGLGSQS